MTDNRQELQIRTEHPALSNEVISEYDLCVILGISANTLDRMRRDNGLPFVHLDRNNRCYEIKTVLGWLRTRIKEF